MKKTGRNKTKPVLNSEAKPKAKQKDMVVQLILPPAALRAIGIGGKWSGKIDAEITGPQADRMQQISMRQENQRIKQKYVLPRAIRSLIESWNSNTSPPPHEGHDRNRQFSNKAALLNRPALDRITDEIPNEELDKLMACYFKACTLEEHVWEGKDHRYKTLSGFVKAVLKARDDDSVCWWEDAPLARTSGRAGTPAYMRARDPYAETTKMVADIYAQVVLGKDTYGNPDDHWAKFAGVSKRIERIIEAGVGVSSAVLAKAVVRSAQQQAEQFNNRTVFPGNLLTDNLWKLVLPQYLEDYLPGVKLPEIE